MPAIVVYLAYIIGLFVAKDWEAWYLALFSAGIAHVVAVYGTSALLFEITICRTRKTDDLVFALGSITAGTIVLLFLLFRFATVLFPTTFLGLLASMLWALSYVKRYTDSEMPRNTATVICAGLVLVLVESLLLVLLIPLVQSIGHVM